MAAKEYKIFSLEDDVTIQGILKGFLTRYMKDNQCVFKLSMFSDPVQGLFELTSNGNQYKVIFMDVHMPMLTGDEIYESLRHVNPDLLGRILFVTGFADDVASRFPNIELNVLHKPFKYDDFTTKLNFLLRD